MRVARQNSERMVQLDGLRALGVFAVLIHHTVSKVKILELGTLGVRLFFVLSGFLITGILLEARAKAKESGSSRAGVLGAFYVRRILRIFPPYYLALAVGVMLGMDAIMRTLGWDLSYTINWWVAWHGFPGRPADHLWSLAIEEQFYLVMPVLVLFCPRKVLPFVLGAGVLFSPVCRLLIGLGHYGEWERATMPTFSNFDTLGMGALLAVLRCQAAAGSAGARRLLNGRGWVLAAGLLLLVLSMALIFMDKWWRVLLVVYALSNALVFAWVVDRGAEGFGGIFGRMLSAKPIRYVGTISYGIYLYHEFVGAELDVLIAKGHSGVPTDGVMRFILVTGITVVIGGGVVDDSGETLNSFKRFVPYVRGIGPMAGNLVGAGTGLAEAKA